MTKKCVVSFYSEIIDNLKIFNQFNSFINFIFAFLSYVLHKPGHCYPVAVNYYNIFFPIALA